MPQRDLFGGIVRKRFPAAQTDQLNFLGGPVWMYAAKSWAAGAGLETRRWRVGQEFETQDGVWHRIAWNDEARSWDVTDVPAAA